MDASQWLEHAISVVFGGAGGIAAGLAKLTASLSSINKRQDALDKRQDTLERRLDVLSEQKKVQSKQLDDLKAQMDHQMDDLKKQLTAQAGLSHDLISDKMDELHKDMSLMRMHMTDQQADLQRSLGAVEGTLKMIARNGCARACSSGPTTPDFPSEPPTRGGRNR